MDISPPQPSTAVVLVAHHVVEALAAAGVNRMAAADATGIPRSTFYRKAAGHGAFDVEELTKIGALLGTTAAGLMSDAERQVSA